MASSPELVQYIADQLSPCGIITFKKMFGEYDLYLNGKMFASVCDDTLFVKPTKAGRALVPDCLLAPPYPGAKDCLLIENVDNLKDPVSKRRMVEIVRIGGDLYGNFELSAFGISDSSDISKCRCCCHRRCSWTHRRRNAWYRFLSRNSIIITTDLRVQPYNSHYHVRCYLLR